LGTAVLALFLIAANAAAAPSDPLGHEGRWITDATGRVVILHGFNMVAKRPPYHSAALGFGADDARFLRRHGFNTVRLGVIYTAVEPSPGHYQDDYLDEIARESRILARHGIYVLLDFHQDMYNRTFEGGGFPDWAVQDDGLAPEPNVGFPGNYYYMPALQHAYDHFWANSPGPDGVGLQDHFASAWRHVAERLGKLKRLVGYDILNEPSPGTRTNECRGLAGCPDFDAGALTAFDKRVFGAIRSVDRKHLVWREPLAGFGFGTPSFVGATGDRRSGFTFHAYCAHGVPQFELIEPDLAPIPCSEINPRIFQHAGQVSKRTGEALLLGEFGANIRFPESVVEATSLADRFMVGWQEWTYVNEMGEPLPPVPGSPDSSLVFDPRQPPRGANVDRARLDLLARPYPQAIAGTPKRWIFNPATRRFRLVYKTHRVGGGRLPQDAVTEIVVPKLQYPHGYRVRLKGARLTSRKRGRLLKVVAKPGARRVSVTIRRR
jgi:endoglycosylceramidase